MEGFERLGDGLDAVWTAVVDWVPEVLMALIVLAIGLRLASWIRGVLETALDREWFNSFIKSLGPNGPLVRSSHSAAAVVASIFYGILVIVVLVLSSEVLGLRQVETAIDAIVRVIPGLVAATIAVLLAASFGQFISKLIEPWSQDGGVRWLPPAVRWAFIVISVLTAFEVLGFGELNVRLVEFALIGLALVGVIALGVGGIPEARTWWSDRRVASVERNAPTDPATDPETTDGGTSR